MAITADELLILIKARDDASRVFSSVRRNFATFGKDMARVGRSMTTMVTLPIVGIGVALFKMAGDAVESESLFGEVMEDMADSVRDWSTELRDQLGLNDFELRKQVSTLFLMTSAMGIQEDAALDMSKTLVELAADMASFRNMRMEEAFEKITAGITGEMEPLKRIGILVNEASTRQALLNANLITGSEVLTDQQKIMGRYLAILQQTTKDQGDLARTMESPINQVRRLVTEFKLAAITLGTELMPQFKILIERGRDVMEWLKEAVTSFANLTREKQAMFIKVVALVAAIGPLLVILGGLVSVLGVLLSPIGAVIAALATVVVFARAMGVTWEDVSIGMIQIWGEIVKFVNKGVVGILDGLTKLQEALNIQVFATEELADEIEHLSLMYQVDLLNAINDIISPSREAAESVANDLEGMGLSAEEVAAKVQAAMDAMGLAFNEAGDKIEETADMTGFLEARMLSYSIAQQIANKEIRAAKEALQALKDATREQVDELSDMAELVEAAGEDMGKSLLEGIIRGVDSEELQSRFLRIIENLLIDSVWAMIMGSSPSKVYEKIGQSMMQGLAQGINANINLVSPSLGMAVGVVGGGGSTAPASAFPSAPASVTHDNRRSVVIEQVVLQTGFGSKGEEQEAVRRFNSIVDEMN